MTDKIEHEEFYFGSDKIFLRKINEMVEAMNQMRLDIDELMNDLFYRNTLDMENSERV
jgi:hypothetical protein